MNIHIVFDANRSLPWCRQFVKDDWLAACHIGPVLEHDQTSPSDLSSFSESDKSISGSLTGDLSSKLT